MTRKQELVVLIQKIYHDIYDETEKFRFSEGVRFIVSAGTVTEYTEEMNTYIKEFKEIENNEIKAGEDEKDF